MAVAHPPCPTKVALSLLRLSASHPAGQSTADQPAGRQRDPIAQAVKVGSVQGAAQAAAHAVVGSDEATGLIESLVGWGVGLVHKALEFLGDD